MAHPLQCQQHGCLSSHTVANQGTRCQAQLGQEALQVLAHGLVARIWAVGAVTMVPSIHCQHLGRWGSPAIQCPSRDCTSRWASLGIDLDEGGGLRL